MKRARLLQCLALAIGGLYAPLYASAAQPPVPVAYAGCFARVGAYYDINPVLLEAIAQHESGMNPLAVDRDSDGSVDIGLMQINSSHFATLARLGYPTPDLWYPCVNIAAGGWVLARDIRRLGLSWRAVGAYNSGDPQIARRYALRIAANVVALERAHASALPR